MELNRQLIHFWVRPHSFPKPSPHPSLSFLSCTEGTHKGLVNAYWFFYQPLPDLGTVGIQPQASDQGGNFFWIFMIWGRIYQLL